MWNIIFIWYRYINYETAMDLPISKTNLWWPKEKHGGGVDKSGAWDKHTHTTMYKIDNQQRSTV